MPLLRFDAVHKRYPGGRAALEDVSFRVEAGEVLFVTGHSGAGKSTLLKLLHLAERPDRGAVLLEDRNLAAVRGRDVARYRRRVGVVFQDHRLLPHWTIADNVALPLRIAGVGEGETAARVRDVLGRVGLGDRLGAFPPQLSTGEQQRVGIARAIVSRPVLLVADEPTGNLDPQLAAEVMGLFLALPEQGSTVLIASHDLALIKRTRQRTLVLHEGRLVDDIAAQDLAA
jgi:cell division transport system ATP-binding protein